MGVDTEQRIMACSYFETEDSCKAELVSLHKAA